MHVIDHILTHTVYWPLHSLPEYAGEIAFSLTGGTHIPFMFSSLVIVNLHRPRGDGRVKWTSSRYKWCTKVRV